MQMLWGFIKVKRKYLIQENTLVTSRETYMGTGGWGGACRGGRASPAFPDLRPTQTIPLMQTELLTS